jgi:hypothetical protein
MDGMENQLITLNRAARLLRVPFRWLREEAEAGRIPCLRAGKAILCDFAAVEAALLLRARQTATPADEEAASASR